MPKVAMLVSGLLYLIQISRGIPSLHAVNFRHLLLKSSDSSHIDGSYGLLDIRNRVVAESSAPRVTLS